MAAHQGWVATEVAAELPGLGVSWIEVEGARLGKSDASVRERLRRLSDRFYGGEAIRMRERPIPWAYRVFFRQIGLDPDQNRTPIEQIVFDRLHDGAFVSAGLPADALTIATVETGVALRALDASLIEGALGVRASAPGESSDGAELPTGTLVLADARQPLAVLFGPGSERPPAPECERVAIVATRVGSIAEMAVEEALAIAAAELTPP